jgi:hypothetical protein
MLSAMQNNFTAELRRSVTIEAASSVTVDVQWLLKSNSSPKIEVTSADSGSQLLNSNIVATKSADVSSLTFDLRAGNFQVILSNFTAGAVIRHISFKTSHSTKNSKIFCQRFLILFFSFHPERFGKRSWVSIFLQLHHLRKSRFCSSSSDDELQ